MAEASVIWDSVIFEILSSAIRLSFLFESVLVDVLLLPFAHQSHSFCTHSYKFAPKMHGERN